MSRRDPLNPDAGRELQELDAALAGEAADPELAALVTLVREERPEPATEFARELDEWAAAGFPRAARPGAAAPGARRVHRLLPASVAAPLGRLVSRPRRSMLPALGAAATLLLIVVVGVSALNEGGTGGDGAAPSAVQDSPAAPSEPAPLAAGSGDGSGAGAQAAPIPPPGADPAARGRGTRRVERAASLALSAPRDDVDDVADSIIRVTDRFRGIVVSSSVSDGRTGEGATFELRIPAARLQEALAELSKLGEVVSRNQTSTDITGVFVSPRERLTDALAERKALLAQLARADTPNETESIRARLRGVSREIAAAGAELRRLRERAQFSRVTVTVDARGSSGGGAWGLDDALDDAERMLAVSLGVAIVGLAVLAPFALAGGALAVAGRAVRRRRREHALDAV